MPTRIEKNWDYLSAQSAIVGSEGKKYDPWRADNGIPDIFRSKFPEADIIYKLSDKTKFDPKVWKAWWSKGPLNITFTETIFGPNRKNPPIVNVEKIELPSNTTIK